MEEFFGEWAEPIFYSGLLGIGLDAGPVKLTETWVRVRPVELDCSLLLHRPRQPRENNENYRMHLSMFPAITERAHAAFSTTGLRCGFSRPGHFCCESRSYM